VPTETLTASPQATPNTEFELGLAARWTDLDSEADVAEHYAAYAPWAPADFAGVGRTD